MASNEEEIDYIQVDPTENVDSLSPLDSNAVEPAEHIEALEYVELGETTEPEEESRDIVETVDNTQTTQPTKTGESSEEPEKTEKLAKLPLSRVKHIVKMDPDVHLASQEAVFLVTKSTELFLESLAKECYKHTSASKRKTLQRRDIDSAIDSIDCLAFLEGTLDALQ